MIKIDMEMPKSCEVCKLKTWEQSGMFNKAICAYTGNRAKRINDRPKDCPLTECEDEKSCDYETIKDGEYEGMRYSENDDETHKMCKKCNKYYLRGEN